MSGRRQSGNHRDVHVPWRARLVCAATDHDIDPTPLGAGRWLCLRCDRTIRRGAQ